MRGVLAAGMDFQFMAKGWSMLPFIWHEDVLRIIPSGNRAPQAGDVVACLDPASRRLVVHLVVARQGARLLVKGDNSNTIDGSLEVADVLGIVSQVMRKGKTVRLGTGHERRLLALVSRLGILKPVVTGAVLLKNSFKRRR